MKLRCTMKSDRAPAHVEMPSLLPAQQFGAARSTVVLDVALREHPCGIHAQRVVALQRDRCADQHLAFKAVVFVRHWDRPLGEPVNRSMVRAIGADGNQTDTAAG